MVQEQGDEALTAKFDALVDGSSGDALAKNIENALAETAGITVEVEMVGVEVSDPILVDTTQQPTTELPVSPAPTGLPVSPAPTGLLVPSVQPPEEEASGYGAIMLTGMILGGLCVVAVLAGVAVKARSGKGSQDGNSVSRVGVHEPAAPPEDRPLVAEEEPIPHLQVLQYPDEEIVYI